MKIGIDKIGFSIPPYFISLEDLADSRNVPTSKYTKGLLQQEMSVSPISQDIVTLGASAANKILTEEDKKNIDYIIMCSESGVDFSKSASIFIKSLLSLKDNIRSIEIKEACYSGTAGLMIAKNYVASNPNSSVLVIMADIAKYGINSSGESTQGAGSCAILIKKDPSILSFNDDNVFFTYDVMDFWRPNYSQFPIVDGHFSSSNYLNMLNSSWIDFSKKHNYKLNDFKSVCFHIPFPKLGLKGLKQIIKYEKNLGNIDENHEKTLRQSFDNSIIYNKKVGNIYTGSLYLSLLSLLENDTSLKENDKIALFSYGSGSVCEIFSVNVEKKFKLNLQDNKDTLDNIFNRRIKLTVDQYEKMFFENIMIDENGNTTFKIRNDDFSDFHLLSISNHKRIYGKKETNNLY